MTTTPFLGCKISLISKSEIRYEGILYTIDPKESTIALAKVRSYGTEDRPAERQVPPREEIFEYIIFRAGDIKDLIVDDPPTSIAPGLADPAIIQAHSTSTTSAATFPSTTFPQMTSGQRSSVPPFTGTNAINSLSGTITAQSTAKTSASTDSRSRNSTPTNVQQHNRHSPHPDNWRRETDWTVPSAATKQNTNKENQRKSTTDRGQYRRGGGSGGGVGPGQSNFNQNYSGKRGGGPPNAYRQHGGHPNTQPPQSGNRFAGSVAYNRQFNSYSGVGRRPQNRPHPQRGGSQNRLSNRPVKEPLKFEEDFDFDKANEDFKEIEEKMSNLKVDGQSADKIEGEKTTTETKVTDGSTNGDKDAADSEHFYDKSKSFFDQISCEALEREKGNVQRIDWKAERKLNSETFGVPLSYRRFGFGRGRGGYSNRGYSGFRTSRGGFSRGGGGGDGRRFNGPQPPRSRN